MPSVSEEFGLLEKVRSLGQPHNLPFKEKEILTRYILPL
jgi:hypothetical protein